MAVVRLSWHFTAEELRCRCGCGLGDDRLEHSPRLLSLLEAIRSRLDRPLHPTSGIRCVAHNRAVGGHPDSPHLRGTAVDLAVADAQERFELVSAAIRCGCLRIGVAESFVHLDVDTERNLRRLWTY